MGRMTGRKLPGGQIEAMLYNSIGQLTAKTDFAGKTTQYSYDQRGRLLQKKPDPTLGEATVSFSYPNELTKISTRGSIQNIYKYDASRGWLNSVQTNNGTINYGYDAAGNRTVVKITGKDGGVRETDYAYDQLNRVSTVSRTGVGTLASYSYDAIGNVFQVTRANGVMSTFGYDDLHRLTSIQHKQGATTLSQFNYTLSADGKRNTLQEYVKYPTGQTVASVNRTVYYGYDNAGRLNAEQRQSNSTLTAGGTVANTARTLWTYDNVGNRITQAVSNYDGLGVDSPSVLKSTFNTAYDYNSNDWLTKTTSTRNDDSGESTFVSNFEYNANGSQTAITSNVGRPEEQRVPYFYDFEQKLTRIGDMSDTVKRAYAYDADGNRIAESNTNAGTTDTRNYLIDPNNSNAQIVEEYNNSSTLLAHYDWNDAELLREATRTADESTFTIREPLVDGHNSTRQLLDSTGAISDVYAYDAWGNQQINTGGSFNPYRYNSQRLDTSGLYYLRARQYSSGIGRFLTHDPMMGNMNNPITQHRYLYAGDDAVSLVDPSGMEFSLAGVTSSMAIETSLSTIDLTNTWRKGSSIGTLAGNIIVTGIAAYNIFQSYLEKGRLVPDGAFVITSLGVQGVGLTGSADLMLYRDRKTASSYAFTSGEVGLSPISTLPYQSPLTAAVGFGFTFNSDDPSDFSGWGYSATWPLVMAKYGFRDGPLGPFVDFTVSLAVRQMLWLANSVSFNYSVGGASSVTVWRRTNTFTFTSGRTSQPIPLGRIAKERGNISEIGRILMKLSFALKESDKS
jgi:RHS repeat-associated protein